LPALQVRQGFSTQVVDMLMGHGGEFSQTQTIWP
jgi:hypothetical protein